MISIVVAMKFIEDKYYKMEYYSKVAGISKKEMAVLESIWLDILEF